MPDGSEGGERGEKSQVFGDAERAGSEKSGDEREKGGMKEEKRRKGTRSRQGCRAKREERASASGGMNGREVRHSQGIDARDYGGRRQSSEPRVGGA